MGRGEQSGELGELGELGLRSLRRLLGHSVNLRCLLDHLGASQSEEGKRAMRMAPAPRRAWSISLATCPASRAHHGAHEHSTERRGRVATEPSTGSIDFIKFKQYLS